LRPDFLKQFFFERVRHGHFACDDLLWSRSDETEFAVAQAFGTIFTCRANGRPEDAASHGAPRVNVAAARSGVERGASGVVGEVPKLSFVGFRCSEHAGLGIAGKVWTLLTEPRAGTEFNCGGERRIFVAQSRHARTKPRGVEGVDGERSVAALRTADAARKQVSSAAGGIGKRGVDTLEKLGFADLHKLGIARGKRHESKDNSPSKDVAIAQ
jgi:hypothetical protein